MMIFFEGMIIVVCISCIVLLMFHRDPERIPPQKANVIVSPADGRIRYIKKISNSQIPISIKKKKRFTLTELAKTDIAYRDVFLIGIEMNILDVHVNRAPVKGEIVFQKHHCGEFYSLRNNKALIDNERMTTLFDTGVFQIGVVQIASRLVRRIVSFFDIGNTIELGERFGIIKYGSQVDLIIPTIQGLNIQVKEGDKMRAGISIIAEYDNSILNFKQHSMKKNLRIFLLAFPDNPIGRIFLQTFIRRHVFLSGIIIEKKSLKNNWVRYRKKIYKDGIAESIRRMMQIFWMKCSKRSIEDIARKSRIPIYRVDRFNSRECETLLDTLHVDLLAISSAPILKENIFKKAKMGCLNAHPGILPKYRGIGANAHAIKNGDSPGITIHFIDKDIDKGRIIVQEKIKIQPNDTIQKINDRAVARGALLMSRVIHRIQDDLLILPEIREIPGEMYYPMPFSEVRKLNKKIKKIGKVVDHEI